MSRDLLDDNYYVSHGGKVPVKWTAPEVSTYAFEIECCSVYKWCRYESVINAYKN